MAGDSGVLSLAIYAFLALAITAVLLVLAGKLGERKPSPEKERPYESGVIPVGPARVLKPVPFYQVAIFFLIFDVEAAFIFSWAIAYDALGWAGWLEMAFFILVLLAGLWYIWRKGGLEWGTSSSASSTR